MRLIDLPGLLHLTRIEDRTKCLGCKFLRGTIDIDATKKDIHKFCSKKSFSLRKDYLQGLCNKFHHCGPFTLYSYADRLSY